MNARIEPGGREVAGYPARSYAWYVVSILTIAHVISFLDRQILALMVGPIKQDLGISDTQMSLLLGLAFAIFYTFLGVPIGRLADRSSRRNIITIGVTVWCAMTAMCGLARNYTQLFLARIGVGVGEATLTPSALSIISDYFPREYRGRAVGFYNMGVSVGAGLAMIVGGQVITFVAKAPPVVLPVVGELAAWQTVFLLVGLPGLLIAMLMRTVKEPARHGKMQIANDAGKQSDRISIRDTVKFLGEHRRTYIGLAATVSGSTILGYGFLSWLPTMYIRTWEWSIAKVTVTQGIVLLIAGPIGVNLAGWWADRSFRRGNKSAHARVLVISAPVMLVASALLPLMPTGELAILLFAPHILGAAGITAAGGAALMLITPNQLRGQTTAIYYFIISLAGLTLGPTSVALFTDYVFRDEALLRYSMAIVGLLAGLLALASAILTVKPYQESIEEAETWGS